MNITNSLGRFVIILGMVFCSLFHRAQSAHGEKIQQKNWLCRVFFPVLLLILNYIMFLCITYVKLFGEGIEGYRVLVPCACYMKVISIHGSLHSHIPWTFVTNAGGIWLDGGQWVIAPGLKDGPGWPNSPAAGLYMPGCGPPHSGGHLCQTRSPATIDFRQMINLIGQFVTKATTGTWPPAGWRGGGQVFTCLTRTTKVF